MEWQLEKGVLGLLNHPGKFYLDFLLFEPGNSALQVQSAKGTMTIRREERDMPDAEPDSRPETKPIMAPMVYRVEERPSGAWACLLFGWQHTLVDISPFVLPLAVAAALGMNDGETARLINFGLLAMGVATLIQTTVGNRLPIIQGPSATLAGTLAPVAALAGGPAMWGAVFAGALTEAAIGISGALGRLRKNFPQSVAGVVVISIGLSLGKVAVSLSLGDGSLKNFLYAGGVIGLIFCLQIGAARVRGGILSRASIFISIWVAGLLVGGALGDVQWSLIAAKPWFEVPTLFPFGGPGFGWEFSGVAILGVFAGYLGSMVESIGDYTATCAVAGERLEERHINRGIFAEGLGCLTASALGGLPCTSYTQNIGIIATTGVASRFVVQVAAGILMLYGLCPKFGALLAAMPRAVLGGVFLVVCGMIAMSGVRLLGAAGGDAGEALIAGFTLVAAVGIPYYCTYALGSAWLETIPAGARLLMTNTVALAVLLGISLNAAAQALRR